jgi:thiol-disulfide isomerase/thioredoxin
LGKRKAEASGKLVFVDAYTTWCGPCKWMAKNVFTNDEVANFYSENFICLKLDMEKGEGKEFAVNYDVHSYPTFLFIDAKSQKVHQTCGSKEAIDFLIDGKNALNPETQLIGFIQKYEAGQRDFSFLRDYARILQNANMSANTVVDELIGADADYQLLNEKDFDMLANFSDLNTKSFQYLMENREKYESIVKKEKINEFITSVFLIEASKAGKNNSPEMLADAQSKIEGFKIENVKELSTHMNWQYAQITKNELFEAAKVFIDNFRMDDSNELNNAAWAIFENSSEADKLETAASWAKQSVEIKKGFANLDTYANLMHKLGKNKDALRLANEAIELGKKQEMDTTETENLVKSIELALKTKK